MRHCGGGQTDQGEVLDDCLSRNFCFRNSPLRGHVITIDLVDTILKIIRHTEINKRNKKNTADNINALVVGAQQEQAPWRTCTNQECINRGSTTHYSD